MRRSPSTSSFGFHDKKFRAPEPHPQSTAHNELRFAPGERIGSAGSPDPCDNGARSTRIDRSALVFRAAASGWRRGTGESGGLGLILVLAGVGSRAGGATCNGWGLIRTSFGAPCGGWDRLCECFSGTDVAYFVFAHACARVREACAGVREACAGAREACAGAREACAGVREACAGAREACAGVSQALESVSEASEKGRFASAGFSDASE